MRKLTLSADADVIELAKKVAGERGTSVSEMFSQFVRSMARPGQRPKTPSKTRQATGLVRLPKGKTDRELIEEAMAQRHLR